MQKPKKAKDPDKDRSRIIWGVAERDDAFATLVGQTIRAQLGGLLGVSSSYPISDAWESNHTWGRTSDAIFSALSAEMQAILRSSKKNLTAESAGKVSG
jgi:hypothetical protein